MTSYGLPTHEFPKDHIRQLHPTTGMLWPSQNFLLCKFIINLNSTVVSWKVFYWMKNSIIDTSNTKFGENWKLKFYEFQTITSYSIAKSPAFSEKQNSHFTSSEKNAWFKLSSVFNDNEVSLKQNLFFSVNWEFCCCKKAAEIGNAAVRYQNGWCKGIMSVIHTLYYRKHYFLYINSVC